MFAALMACGKVRFHTICATIVFVHSVGELTALVTWSWRRRLLQETMQAVLGVPSQHLSHADCARSHYVRRPVAASPMVDKLRSGCAIDVWPGVAVLHCTPESGQI